MNISISPATKKLLNRQLKSGQYENADALVREALKSLEFVNDHEDGTQAAIDRGIAQADRGELRPWEEVRAELHRRFLKK